MIFKKLKDPFLIISLLLMIAALVTGGLLHQHLSEPFRGPNNGNQNLHLAEGDEGFYYLLPPRATPFQEELFYELLAAQEAFAASETTANKEQLAALVVQNFIADFFTWSNKEGRSDVGGLQFIASDIRQNFRTAAIDGFYLYLNQYMERYGQDRLMEVGSIFIDAVDLDHTFTITEIDPETDEEINEHHPVIKVQAQWVYRGMFPDVQNEAVFYLIFEDDHLSIRALIEMEEVEEALYG